MLEFDIGAVRVQITAMDFMRGEAAGELAG
jgi:hypothetical protein